LFREEIRHLLEEWPREQEREDDVKFRLVYDGPLPPNDRGLQPLKQEIRRQLHPQLQALWQDHPALAQLIKRKPEPLNYRPVDRIADAHAIGAFKFVPLVRQANRMACRLEILVLMRKEPYQVFSGDERGDLDNRIKTLIDGLRKPRQATEVKDLSPLAGEEPFYVLLEDDRVVYEFAVQSDRLLAPAPRDKPERDVVAIIGVHVTTNERHEIAGYSEGFGLVE
jgi:hypothetical protein